MFEMLILLFTNKTNPVSFAKDEDLFGKTLCRPRVAISRMTSTVGIAAG